MEGPNADFREALEEAKQVIRKCFKDYSLSEVFLSFNGGKDCTVLLDVVLDVLLETEGRTVDQLTILCIKTDHPFSELDEFMEQVESHYKVKLTWAQGDLKTALVQTLEANSCLKACLMGTRRTDPYCENLKFTQKTDPGWPPLVRVSPLLNWSYHQVWSYIHTRKVPYCSLYDKGYTSIGSTMNTWPNPALAYKDSNGCLSYHPAWMLADGALERKGRGIKPSSDLNGLRNGNGTCCLHNGA